MTVHYLSTEPDRLHWTWWLAGTLAIVAAYVFVTAAWKRVPYPHELEWMEGALADHAWRVARGLPLYCEPTPEHVPFLYAPLLFWIGSWGIVLGADGILSLRLVSVACAFGTMLLIGHWVRRETGRVAVGLIACGLFLAGYGWLAWWYDLARNDTLLVLLVLGTAYVLRQGGERRWLWAAALATAAVFAKQSALMWLPAIAVGSWFLDRATTFRFVITTLAAAGCGLMALHGATGGWSTFYLFTMPSHHALVGEAKLGFWLHDVLPLTPMLLLGLLGFVASWRIGRRGDALFFAAFGSGGLVTSWLSRLHVGGFDNVLMYGFVGGCVLAPIAAASHHHRWRRLAPWLLLVQFGWLGYETWQRSPSITLLPSDAHRQAHDELREFVAAQPGPVWVPGHGAISTRAGKGTGAHGQAVFDLLQLLPKGPDGLLDLSAIDAPERLEHLPPFGRRALASLFESSADALRRRRFAALVVDEVGAHAFVAVFGDGIAGVDRVLGTDDDSYVRLPGRLLRAPGAIAPLIGYSVHSPYALVPRRE